MMTARIFQILAWLALTIIIFVTVSPIALRPHDVLPVNADRALAFTAMAALFVWAYPRHFPACVILLVLGAGAIELLQNLSPTRHAQAHDAVVKAFGACAGASLAWASLRLRTTILKRQD
jgi:hypothetical protein